MCNINSPGFHRLPQRSPILAHPLDKKKGGRPKEKEKREKKRSKRKEKKRKEKKKS